MNLHDVFDEAADLAMRDRTLDPATILARSAGSGPGLRKGSSRWENLTRLRAWGPVVLVAAAVVGLLLVLLPTLHRAPEPARQPPRPGAVPRTLFLPGAWLPDVTDQPISRAVYVASAAPDEDGKSAGPRGPWLVGADKGEYRALPVTGDASATVLSADGRHVAWAQTGPYGSATQVRVVDVPTGALRTIDLPGVQRRGLRVSTLAFDLTGTRLAVHGGERIGDNVENSGSVVLIETRTGRQRQVCRTSMDFDRRLVGWTADGRLVAGCLEASTGSTGPVPVDPLPAAETEEMTSALPPTGMPTGTALLSTDGTQRWTLTDLDSGEGARTLAGLLGPGLPGAGVDLGQVTGAQGLAVTSRGIVVTRWSARENSAGGMVGPSSVVLVPVDGPGAGTVRELTTVRGDLVRAIAIAGDVVADGRSTAGAEPGNRLLDLAWWSWAARKAAAWPAHLPGPVQALAVAALGAGLVLIRRRTTPRPPEPGTSSDRRPMRWPAETWLTPVLIRTLGALTGVVLLIAGSGLLLLPTEAAPASAKGGQAAGQPVLPRVLTDQRLRPPRAFDATGRPRTTAVGMIVHAVIAGRPGLYGTDAATGALVDLGNVPGIPDALSDSPTGWPTNAAVSPNGRFLSNAQIVVDLHTANVTRLSDAVPVSWSDQEYLATSVAVFNDGSVVFASSDGGRLWRFPPPGGNRSAQPVTGVDDVAYVKTVPGNRVLVSHFGDEKPVELVDLTGPEPDVVALPGLAQQQEQVSVTGSTLVRHNADGRLEQRALSDPVQDTPDTAFDVLAGVDTIDLTPVSSDRTTLVALGAGRRTPLALLRVPLDVAAGAAGTTSELTRIDLGPLGWPGTADPTFAVQRVRPAAEVVASAFLIDAPSDPWWAPLTGHRWRTGAVVALGVGALWVVLWFAGALGRHRSKREPSADPR